VVEKYNHFFGLYLQVIKDVYDPEKPYDNLKDCIRHCERFREQLIGMVKLIAEMGEFTREAADKEVERIIEKFSSIDICHAYVTEGEVMVFVEAG
jgi:hypothetical protein